MIVYEYITRRRKIAELGAPIRHPAESVPVLRALIDGAETERLVVVAMNTKNVPIASETVYLGHIAGSSVRVGEVFRLAVRMNAATIIVGHNHPSGDPAASSEDIRVTADIAAAGKILDIEVLDHIILGDDDRWVSLRALGAM